MVSIPATLESDKKGYFDRECPNENCLYVFKILMKDWEEKVSDEEVHCPMCGHIDTSDKWWTQDQLEKMQEIALSWVMSEIQEGLARATRRNKYIRIKYKPEEKITFENNPIGQREEWENEICCERCGTHYCVIGSAYFCPCCGYNSAINSYISSLEGIRNMLDSLTEMRGLLTEKYDIDTAETMSRSMLESSIGDMISAFQKFACCKYEELSGKPARVNDFQIVDKGNRLFKKIAGRSYSDWLSNTELELMKTMFQRRHILEHNGGIVDQIYLDNTNDSNYYKGQRIIVKESDAYSLLDILNKIGHELIELNRGGSKYGNS